MTLQFVRPEPGDTCPNVLLYGPPKSGKTTGACSAPGGILLLNADLPNATRYAHQRDLEHRILEVDYQGFDTLVDIAHGLRQEADGKAARLIDTVVVDPVGELHRRLLEEQSKRAIRPTLNQYGDAGTHLERFCRSLCELPVNVVFVCHEQPVKDEASGQIERLPYTGTTNPALGQKLMGMVDIVGYCGVTQVENDKPQYMAQLINGSGRRGGDRFDVLGEFAPLDLSQWFAQIRQPGQPHQERSAA